MLKKRNLGLIILTVGLLLVISLSTTKISASGFYNISEISHTPETLQQGQNLTVEIVFVDDSDIDSVKLLICSLSPTFACKPQPYPMSEIASLTYSVDFLVDYDDGTEVGYHIMISYLNGSSIIVPDSDNFLALDNLVEPLTDDFYVSAGYVGGISETGCCGILGAVLAVVSSTIFIKRKKK